MTSTDEIRKGLPRRVKKPFRLVINSVRYATGNFREKPDFVIIGAAKCGTTSLYEYLSRHPNVFPSEKKEIYYFNDNYSKGMRWYKSHSVKDSSVTKDDTHTL